MRDIEKVEMLIRELLPLPSDVGYQIYKVKWTGEDDRRYNFFFKKVWHWGGEWYSIGWDLLQVQEAG